MKILNIPGRLMCPVEPKRTVHTGCILEFDKEIDVDCLKVALDKTLKCYPYLSCTHIIEDNNPYFVENDAPVPIINSEYGVSPLSDASNNHFLGLSHFDKTLRVVLSHIYTDGFGISCVALTLVYYYARERYNQDFKIGNVINLENTYKELQVRSYSDLDYKDVDMSVLDKKYCDCECLRFEDLCEDASIKQNNQVVVTVDAKKFVELSKTFNASPSVAAVILSAKSAYDYNDYDGDKKFCCRITVDGRKVLGLPVSMFNCSFASHYQIDKDEVSSNEAMQKLGQRVRSQLKEQASKEYVSAQAKSFVDGKMRAAIPSTTLSISYMGILDFGEITPHLTNVQVIEESDRKINMYQFNDRIHFV